MNTTVIPSPFDLRHFIIDSSLAIARVCRRNTVFLTIHISVYVIKKKYREVPLFADGNSAAIIFVLLLATGFLLHRLKNAANLLATKNQPAGSKTKGMSTEFKLAYNGTPV